MGPAYPNSLSVLRTPPTSYVPLSSGRMRRLQTISHGHQILFYAEGSWDHHLDSFAELGDSNIIYHVDTGDIFIRFLFSNVP